MEYQFKALPLSHVSLFCLLRPVWVDSYIIFVYPQEQTNKTDLYYNNMAPVDFIISFTARNCEARCDVYLGWFANTNILITLMYINTNIDYLVGIIWERLKPLLGKWQLFMYRTFIFTDDCQVDEISSQLEDDQRSLK